MAMRFGVSDMPTQPPAPEKVLLRMFSGYQYYGAVVLNYGVVSELVRGPCKADFQGTWDCPHSKNRQRWDVLGLAIKG